MVSNIEKNQLKNRQLKKNREAIYEDQRQKINRRNVFKGSVRIRGKQISEINIFPFS